MPVAESTDDGRFSPSCAIPRRPCSGPNSAHELTSGAPYSRSMVLRPARSRPRVVGEQSDALAADQLERVAQQHLHTGQHRGRAVRARGRPARRGTSGEDGRGEDPAGANPALMTMGRRRPYASANEDDADPEATGFRRAPESGSQHRAAGRRRQSRGVPSHLSSSLPLVRFLFAGAARVAQRNALLTIAAVIIVVGSLPDLPPVSCASWGVVTGARASAGRRVVLRADRHRTGDERRPDARARLGGWIRSLPTSGQHHRRAVTVGLLLPTLPLVALQVLLRVPGAERLPRRARAGKARRHPLAAFAVAAYATPSRRGLARPVAAAAALLATSGRWMRSRSRSSCSCLGDQIAGSIALVPRDGTRQASEGTRVGARVAWRATGWRALLAPLPALLLIGFGIRTAATTGSPWPREHRRFASAHSAG